MIYIKDRYNKEVECKRLIEAPVWQPKTEETLYIIYAQGYDDVRMIPLFIFFTREEMEAKYAELFTVYMKQAEAEHKEKS